MKWWLIWIAVAIIVISLIFVGFHTENVLADFPKNLLAEIIGILAAFFIGWFFFERRASSWLEKVKGLLEKMERQQQEGRLTWARDVGHSIALLLVEVTHQLVHDLQRIEDDIPAPWQKSVSQHAEEVLSEVANLFRGSEDGQMEICQAAAVTLTQSNGLLERLQTLLQTGPDWIRQDAEVTQGLEEALRQTEQFHPSLLLALNVHPMTRRVRVLPGAFDNIAGHVWSVSLHLYLEQLLRLAKALDEKARREGFDWPPATSNGSP